MGSYTRCGSYTRSVTLLNNVIYVRVIFIAVELIYSQHGSHNHDYATHLVLQIESVTLDQNC